MTAPGPGQIAAKRWTGRSTGWRILAIALGVVGVLAGLVSVLGTVESYGTPSADCGGPAFSVALDGGSPPEGREADCRTSASDQALGGGMFLVAGAALILWPRLRHRNRSLRVDVMAPEFRLAGRPPAGGPEHVTVSLGVVRPPVVDPGWGPALLGLVPIVGPRVVAGRTRHHPAKGLLVLRQVFLSFAAAIALFGFVLTQMDLSPADASMSERSAMVIVGAVALIAVLLGPIVERPLDCSSEETLATTWRTRFFLRIAFGESPALAGFVGALLAGRVSVYALGAAATAVMFVRAAPTASSITKDQQDLRNRACPISLLALLAS